MRIALDFVYNVTHTHSECVRELCKLSSCLVASFRMSMLKLKVGLFQSYFISNSLCECKFHILKRFQPATKMHIITPSSTKHSQINEPANFPYIDLVFDESTLFFVRNGNGIFSTGKMFIRFELTFHLIC